MKILIYCGHPAQYYFFKNAISILQAKNHKVKLLIRSKDILEELLKYYGEEYTNILPSCRKDNWPGIFFGLFKREVRLFKHMKKFKPDIVLGTDPALAHISRLLNIPCMTCLEDDYEVIPHLAKITYPFTGHIFAPNICSVEKYEYKKIGYEGYMKLAYLHPKYFQPNPKIVAPFQSERFFLIRTAKLSAYHDFQIKGLSTAHLREIIQILEQKGKVFITSESEMDEEFQKYSLNIHPAHIHHFIYYADLLISDSQSMSVEAAVLGTPSIRISNFSGRISVLEELEHKYKLTYGFRPGQKAQVIQKIQDLCGQENIKKNWTARKQVMLDDKIDVTKILTDLIEGYSQSFPR